MSLFFDNAQTQQYDPIVHECQHLRLHSERLCPHDGCHFQGWRAVSFKFLQLNNTERVRIVRNILLATTAPHGICKELGIASDASRRRMLRKRRLTQDSERRSTIIYALKGSQICRQAFATIVHLDPKTLQRHANRVANGSEMAVYESKRGVARKGFHGVQRLVVRGFLVWYGNVYGLECPRGRGSSEENPLKLFSSNLTRVDVHDVYVRCWKKLVDAVMELRPNQTRPQNPLSYSLFLRYWADDCPTLRIASSGSDFCDLCTSLKNDLKNITGDDSRRDLFIRLLRDHRSDAAKEFANYKLVQATCNENPCSDTRHFVFDFAEKILLPKLLNQPGQLHFVTGLKFDLFGVSSSNERRNYLYGLPEGHWPNEKTANVVLSMLHRAIQNQSEFSLARYPARRLVLHADNCSGQNKNRFALWYLCWRILMGFEDVIEICFLVAGHTKNVCDGAFGHVKRHLKNRDVHTPKEMMQVIEESSSTTKCVPSEFVDWRNWKDLLGKTFKIPTSFGITKYHVFTFKMSDPGIVYARKLSGSSNSERFVLLGKDKVEQVKGIWEDVRSNDAYKLSITCSLSKPGNKRKISHL